MLDKPRKVSMATRLWQLAGFQGPRVDVLAHRVLDYNAGIFRAVRDNDEQAAMRIVNEGDDCLLLRDAVGACPVHVAFLIGHYELGKKLVLHNKKLATLTYTYPALDMQSRYEGENILHIAIVHRQPELCQWMVNEVPELIIAETTGPFFAPDKPCYFGGTPLLFAFASNQLDVAKHILKASTRVDRDTNVKASPTIFDNDQHGNNVLHLAVLRNLPKIFEFALQFAMENLAAASQQKEHCLDKGIVGFLKTTDKDSYERILGFMMQRNTDQLTPLSLSAAIGNKEMFQHQLRHVSTVAWAYGPIKAYYVPLQDLDQRMHPLDENEGSNLLRRMVMALPFPLARKDKRGFATAIECLCSTHRLSNTLSTKPEALYQVTRKRLEILDLPEVSQLLAKKWHYVAKPRFLIVVTIYAVFLCLINITTLFRRDTYSRASYWETVALGAAEFGAMLIAGVKLTNDFSQIVLNPHAYFAERGAGQLDNICTLVTGLSLPIAIVMRTVIGNQELGDAFASIALIFAWFYLFFFLLGFRTTGPFVIMILRMIERDIVRFFFVYSAVLMGFAQAIYVVHDNREGSLNGLLLRMRTLVVIGFTGEVNYDDNYSVGGRMNTFTQTLVVTYVVLVMILLVNLLIAMMGNTYTEVLEESEQRWEAERANIMVTLNNQCPVEWNQAGRLRYAAPLQSVHGQTRLYLEMEIENADEWIAGTQS